MNISKIVIGIVLIGIGGTAAHAAIDQAARFAALHGETRDAVTGTVGFYSVNLFVGYDRVTGTSPAGVVDVLVQGTTATGTVAGSPFSVNAYAGWMTGYGPRGAIRLRYVGNAITGAVGQYSVNMLWRGEYLEGTIGTSRVSLWTGPLLNTSVAALLAAVL